MKAARIIRPLFVFYTGLCMGGLPAAAHSAQGPFNAGKVIDAVICKADPTQSYALYIPATGNKGPLPVVYFFDPHGSGAFPLRKYASLADKYGFILVGSNNSKNGNDWPTAENTWRHLCDDTKSRLAIDARRIYTCGFSGGAKVASYVAMLQHPEVKGVIAGGAGLPDGAPAADFPFSFTALAGEGDMNMTELVTLSASLDKTHTRHHLVIFDGKHEWAPLNDMNTAFTGLQLDAMQQGLVTRNDAFIDRYIEASRKKLDSYGRNGQWLKAYDECKRAISFLDGLSAQVAWFKAKAVSLAANPLYRRQRQAQEKLLSKEQQTKDSYMQHMQQADTRYWAVTIHGLQAGAHAKNAESPMCQRLLAWLSLAFYSYSNHFINSKSNSEARYFTELYKLADSANSEAWYFSAILHAREGQPQAAENDLMKAAGEGFNDGNRLAQQPEFRQLWDPAHLSGMEKKMQSLAARHAGKH